MSRAGVPCDKLFEELEQIIYTTLSSCEATADRAAAAIEP